MNRRTMWLAAGALAAFAAIWAARTERSGASAPASDRPLMIFFHGYGASERDLEPLARDLKDLGGPAHPQYIFARGPLSAGSGRAWWTASSGFAKAREVALSLAGVTRSATPDGQTQPLAVIGFSQGGTMAIDTALHDKVGLSCAVAIAPARHPEGDWKDLVMGPPTPRIFIAHGSNDHVVPMSVSEDLRDVLLAHGYSVEFMPHSGAHEIPARVRRAVAAFLRECK